MMKPVVMMLVLVTVALSASAQFRPFQRPPAGPRPVREALETPPGEPVEKLDVNELQLRRRDLAGQVVELTFDNVIDLKQAGDGYAARVTYESARMTEGVVLIIPPEGLEFFEPLAEHRGPNRETVYVQVLPSGSARALGTRYSKNKPDGERYSW